MSTSLSLKTDQVPHYCIRPHITTGYRSPHNIPLCLRSIITLHNETINIWTHLLTAIYFMYLLAYDIYELHHTEDYTDVMMISMSALACVICFLCSTVYHTFRCYSEGACQCLLSVDISGIIAMISSTTVVGVYFGFECYPDYQMIYIVIIVLVGMFIVGSILFPQIFAKLFDEEFKVWIYASFGAFGVIPLVHWCLLKGWDRPEVPLFLIKFGKIYGSLAVGFLFYVSKIPERFSRRFDIWFSSHQIWHVFVSLAAYYLYTTSIDYLQLRSQFPCVVHHVY
eukprot:TRINITY_DN8488_c0_g1_i1.p1 TRINITY_DN8488_c0_g1~~TRINITY_DN8488_c0_g1_i1.p1  ORF type:complete len:282 (+),score=20.93 TRINITY_DN8488_c0_g1_i1:1225-2070(+)